MSRKLGKGHPEYINRKENMYVVGEDGTRRVERAYNGKPYTECHGHNALNAYTDLRDKFYSTVPDQWTENMKLSKRKATRLKRLAKSTNHGVTRLEWMSKVKHLIRNNVDVIAYVNDNR